MITHRGTKFDDGADLKPLLEHMECPRKTLEAKEPEYPEEKEVTEKNAAGNDVKVKKLSAGDKYKYELKYKDYFARVQRCESNEGKV